jgi:hypothetical protein
MGDERRVVFDLSGVSGAAVGVVGAERSEGNDETGWGMYCEGCVNLFLGIVCEICCMMMICYNVLWREC